MRDEHEQKPPADEGPVQRTVGQPEPERAAGGRPWIDGEPPRDGKRYEMRRRCCFADGAPWTAWLSTGWWDGRTFVRRNQMRGGTDALIGCTQWRREPP